jgi:tetratricopeptide (TPR) repeat protein
MQTQPDSALDLLQTLDRHYMLEGAQRARFALLYNEALELNSLAFPHDSLIYDAIDYYGSVKDYRKLGQAWLYLGKAFMQLDSITPAMYAFLKATDALQQFKDDDLLGLVTNEMASLYQEQHYNEDALMLFRQSLSIAQRSGNKKHEGYALLKIADLLYICEANVDSVQAYFDRAKQVAMARNDTEFYFTVLTSNAIARKEYTEAKQILFSSIQSFKQGIPTIECYSLLGSLYFDLEQADSARYYKQLVLRDAQATAKQRVSALGILKEIEQLAGNYESALQYAMQFQTLSDSILQSRHAYNLAFARQKYYLDRVIGETSMQKVRFIIVIVIFGILALVGFLGARYFRKKYKQETEQQEEVVKEYVRKSLLNGWNYALFEEKFKTCNIDLTTEADMSKVN